MVDIVAEEIESCQILNIFVSHDEPLFYSAISESNQYFLFHAFDENFADDGESTKSWIIKPISERDLLDFEYGLISSRDILSGYGKFVYIAEISDGKVKSVVFERSSNLSDAHLPDDGHKYKVRENQFPISIPGCEQAAIDFGKPIVDLSMKHTDPARKLDSLLLCETLALFQKMNWSIGLASSRGTKQDKERDKQRIVLEPVRPFAASYGFRLTPVADELGDIDLRHLNDGVDGVLNLLGEAKSAASNSESRSHFDELSLNQKSAFLKLVKHLGDKDLNLTVAVSKSGEERSVQDLGALDSIKFMSTVDQTSTETRSFTATGTMVAHDSTKHTFRFTADSKHLDRRTFQGTVAERIQNKVFATPSRVTVTISYKKTTNLVTDRTTYEFVLTKSRRVPN